MCALLTYFVLLRQPRRRIPLSLKDIYYRVRIEKERRDPDPFSELELELELELCTPRLIVSLSIYSPYIFRSSDKFDNVTNRM